MQRRDALKVLGAAICTPLASSVLAGDLTQDAPLTHSRRRTGTTRSGSRTWPPMRYVNCCLKTARSCASSKPLP